MHKLVLGVFDQYPDADHAYADFLSRGFTSETVSIITREDTVKSLMNVNRDTGRDVANAAMTGGVVGGLLGLLAGVGALTIPGVGALFIAGPITTLLGLTGAAAVTTSGALTGILAGGILGVLKELGVDEVNAKMIENKIKNGAVLVTVDAVEHELDKAKEIFRANSADNITVIDRQHV